MTATQTMSASLAVVLCAASPSLADEPEDADAQPTGEVRKPTGTFEIGAGYGTDDGFMAMARVAQPRLFGSDKGLALTAIVNERWQDFRVRYDDPTLLGTSLRLRGELYSHTKLYSGWRREAMGGDVTLTQRIAPNLDVFAGYKLERVEVTPGATTLFRGGASAPFWRGGQIGAVRAGVQYATIRDDVYPRRGTNVGTSIERADGQLGSDLPYLRTDAWLAHHRPLGPFTLHVRGRASSISDVPLSERLHFDGSADVRGYAPGSILRDGGNFLWTARGELETPSWHGLSLVGFVDGGGLYGDGVGRSIASAGLGVVWRSPIGPLRFDVAFPLDGDGRPRYVLGIGF